MMKFEFELTADDIDEHVQDLIGFHEEFSEFYRTSTRNATVELCDQSCEQLLQVCSAAIPKWLGVL